jgi:hypothetical protein
VRLPAAVSEERVNRMAPGPMNWSQSEGLPLLSIQ